MININISSCNLVGVKKTKSSTALGLILEQNGRNKEGEAVTHVLHAMTYSPEVIKFVTESLDLSKKPQVYVKGALVNNKKISNLGVYKEDATPFEYYQKEVIVFEVSEKKKRVWM